MKDNTYFKWFQDSLSDEQKQEYRDMSINQQKDWYISYLETHYQSRIHTNAMHVVLMECIKKGFSKLALPRAQYVADEVQRLFGYSLRVSDDYTLQNIEQ